MARPRKNESRPGACARLESAFWEMMSEMPFDDITIRAISSKAEVNHNTFYAYFDSLGDMAERLLDAEMAPEAAPEIIAAASGGTPSIAPRTRERFARIRLYARSGSKRLEAMLRRRLQEAWLSFYGIDPKALSRDQVIDLAFIFTGVVTLLGDEGFGIDAQDMPLFFTRPLGQGAAATLEALRTS